MLVYLLIEAVHTSKAAYTIRYKINIHICTKEKNVESAHNKLPIKSTNNLNWSWLVKFQTIQKIYFWNTKNSECVVTFYLQNLRKT